MSLHHNPKIVTDGLVLAYDMDNVAKSFKGKPTTNLITSTIDNWSGSSLRNATLLNETYKRSAVYRLEVAAGADPATNVDAYYMYNVPNLSEGDVFTFSADVRVIQKSTATSQTSAADNGFWIWYAGSSEHVNFKDLELGKWTNIQVTATVGSTYDYIWARIDHDNSIIDIANIQLEQQPFATPFVNGTRSSTQALLDMSKSKNTITATSLTYNSDGTFEFDGTSDYISVSNSSSLNPSINTLICWSKSNTSTWNEYGFLMSKRNVFVMHPNKNAKSVSYYYYLNNSWQSQSVTPSDITVWNMYACSWDGTNINAYLNGELINSGTKTGPLNTSDTGPIEIGRDDGIVSRVFNGHIPFSLIYNRALTEAEIKQNFNATRGRFGI